MHIDFPPTNYQFAESYLKKHIYTDLVSVVITSQGYVGSMVVNGDIKKMDVTLSAASLLSMTADISCKNGNHQRLQTTESPCISTCTTATNLSSLGDFQSNSTINFQRKLNKEDNLRMAIPEIEPLQKKTEVELQDEPSEGLSFRKIFNQVTLQIS
ncbi:unnamed protein product [Callosobruchus maculatus]|uniref:Uncharacterized protein n=1 Tax=Callosobruchus maculatus TaxID=64391 RepID=A0A653BJK8_CALMS|nr:unnamed protein product [Callosobruchus maculatus]